MYLQVQTLRRVCLYICALQQVCQNVVSVVEFDACQVGGITRDFRQDEIAVLSSHDY